MHLIIFLWPFGIFYYLASYFTQVLHYGNPAAQMLAPLLTVAGAPWSAAIAAWCVAGAATLIASSKLTGKIMAFSGGAYKLAFVRPGIIWLLLAALCCFASFCLINWPFAGLPPDFPQDRALMAVLRTAMRKYFMSFCPGGAIGLAGIFFMGAHLPAEQRALAVRWLAVWAAAGSLPHLLQNWGMIAGLGLGGKLAGSLAQGLWQPTISLMLLTLACFSWCWLIWKPQSWRYFSLWGFFLLLLRAGLPVLKHMI